MEADGNEEEEDMSACANPRSLVEASGAGQAAEGFRASCDDSACRHPSHGGVEGLVERDCVGEKAAKSQQAHDARSAWGGMEELGGAAG